VLTIGFIDLFAGAGGFTLGLHRAGGFECALAVELDRDCAETFRVNFADATLLEEDVRNVDFSAFGADVVVGGPPCQGFSTLNRARSGDPRNALSLEMLRCVDQVDACVLVIENVPQFLDADEARGLCEGLEARGFRVRSGVVNSADFGVPQRRLRGLLIAAKTPTVPWPQETHSDGPRANLPPHRTVADAFALLPTVPDGANWHRPYGAPSPAYLERFRSVREGGSRKQLPPDLTLECWKAARGYSDVLGRLRWQRPATTVRTEFFKPEKGRFLHPTADRPITPREAARLQSFPDSFVFPERHTLTSIGRQIGNAVPVRLAESIGRAVQSVLRQDAVSAREDQGARPGEARTEGSARLASSRGFLLDFEK
jgi:DNA (cytosine-5)-methyltransferase 1